MRLVYSSLWLAWVKTGGRQELCTLRTSSATLDLLSSDNDSDACCRHRVSTTCAQQNALIRVSKIYVIVLINSKCFHYLVARFMHSALIKPISLKFRKPGSYNKTKTQQQKWMEIFYAIKSGLNNYFMIFLKEGTNI